MIKEAPVLIVGGGPAGLALALGLARYNVRSILFETKTEIDPHSRALGILPRTLEIFRSWKTYEQFVAAGQLVTKVDIWVAGKEVKPAATIDLSAFSRLSAVPGILILPQNGTESLLLEEVKTAGFTEVLQGHNVIGFEQDATGVTAQVQTPTGATEAFRGQYLVGCDGAHSKVRQVLGWELRGKTYPARVLLHDIRIQDARDQLLWPRTVPKRNGVLAALRYQPEHWRIIATVDPGETDEAALQKSSADRRVEQLFGSGPYEDLWSSVFHIHCRTSPYFRQGRVLLAGDAAHINSPAGGQGMNSGIQDAHNLSWKLARALAGAETEPLLASYELERREAVLKGVDRYTDFLTRFVLIAPDPVRKVFLGFVQTFLRFGPVTFWAAKAGMLDTTYSHSPLISGAGSHLGSRAPDGDIITPQGDRIRLLDLAGPGPALLLFDDGRLPSWDVAGISHSFEDISDLKIVPFARHGAPGTSNSYVDASNGALWNSWQATGATAVLLRPDGHVGWIGRRPFLAELQERVRQALGS